ncbi:MAG: hypothetical protein JWQ35_2451 [Bacteriovoracaceae bacterium]|nr:hypothetical protein [Bacteriovoracaceae bacterium]
MGIWAVVSFAILSTGSINDRPNVCALKDDLAISNTTSVLNFLTDKFEINSSSEPPSTINTSSEFLIERDIRYAGLLQDKVNIELHMKGSDVIIGQIWLKAHESYRGLEVISVNGSGAEFIDRAGKKIKIQTGDIHPVTVLILGEKQDQYDELFSKINSLTFDEFINRTKNLLRKLMLQEYPGWLSNQLEDMLESNKQEFIADDIDGSIDERGFLLAAKTPVEDCSHLPPRKKAFNEYQNTDRLQNQTALSHGDDYDDFLYACKTEQVLNGVCCEGHCVDKLPKNKLRTDQSCEISQDECGHSNWIYSSSLHGESCISTLDGKSYAGHCIHGWCDPCYKPSKSCLYTAYDSKPGDCQYKPLLDGTLCETGKFEKTKKVCISGECQDFQNLLSLDYFKDKDDDEGNPLRSILLNSINSSETNAAFSFLDHSGNFSPNCLDSNQLPYQNGTSCEESGKICFDGQCKKCEPTSDLKAEGVTPCPVSHKWPGKIGKRKSCAEIDICVYE